MDGWTVRYIEGWVLRRMDSWTDGRREGQISNVTGCFQGWMDRQRYREREGGREEREDVRDGWMDRKKEEWMLQSING